MIRYDFLKYLLWAHMHHANQWDRARGGWIWYSANQICTLKQITDACVKLCLHGNEVVRTLNCSPHTMLVELAAIRPSGKIQSSTGQS
jgi:hypothetical protein